jgi:hypothetical protein
MMPRENVGAPQYLNKKINLRINLFQESIQVTLTRVSIGQELLIKPYSKGTVLALR